MLPPPEFLRSEDGGLRIWSLAVLLILVLSVLLLRPAPVERTTLDEGLGPRIVVERL